MHGTDCCTMRGTDLAYSAVQCLVLTAVQCVVLTERRVSTMCGTDRAYGATRPPTRSTLPRSPSRRPKYYLPMPSLRQVRPVPTKRKVLSAYELAMPCAVLSERIVVSGGTALAYGAIWRY
eukprot:2681078-Rhodomonas_salina.2